jgi:hypothetical protein
VPNLLMVTSYEAGMLAYLKISCDKSLIRVPHPIVSRPRKGHSKECPQGCVRTPSLPDFNGVNLTDL